MLPVIAAHQINTSMANLTLFWKLEIIVVPLLPYVGLLLDTVIQLASRTSGKVVKRKRKWRKSIKMVHRSALIKE